MFVEATLTPEIGSRWLGAELDTISGIDDC